MAIHDWFTQIYPLNMVLFHSYISVSKGYQIPQVPHRHRSFWSSYLGRPDLHAGFWTPQPIKSRLVRMIHMIWLVDYHIWYQSIWTTIYDMAWLDWYSNGILITVSAAMICYDNPVDKPTWIIAAVPSMANDPWISMALLLICLGPRWAWCMLLLSCGSYPDIDPHCGAGTHLCKKCECTDMHIYIYIHFTKCVYIYIYIYICNTFSCIIR